MIDTGRPYYGGMSNDTDERPMHFELQRYGETPHGMLGFHLRFTKMRSDVTCRRCLKYLETERSGR